MMKMRSKMMKRSRETASQLSGFVAFALAGALALPAMSFAGGGFMGGQGDIVDEVSSATVVEEVSTDATEVPVDVETDGPLNDNMSSQGKLFGDLYKILRYQGSEESKLIPQVDGNGDPVLDLISGKQLLVASEEPPVGGEPVPSAGYGYYVKEVLVGDVVTYEVATSPYPSQCVQPVADYSKWGDIWGDPTKQNALPLIITYDATWGRSECAVGELTAVAANSDGTLKLTVDEWFIEPDGSWDGVIYCDGIKWTDLIDEVSFGRLNLSRSPEAVLQAAFDEAINSINNADKVEIDAAGRLLLTTAIYEEFDTGLTCEAKLIETVTKAIDSPLENLALYVKLMQDGHLVTPGDERAPIDRSLNGGIPLWKMLELEDGPSTALRPTINITKMREWGLNDLVDVTEVDYYTYYQCYGVDGVDEDVEEDEVECLCVNQDGDSVTCPDVVSRELKAVAVACPVDKVCEGPFSGITTDDGTITPVGVHFGFAASFLAAAADKTGDIGVDMVVYLNSILGINKVIGYSAYDLDGNPAATAINYAENPVYFDYGVISGESDYARDEVFKDPIRGQVRTQGGVEDHPRPEYDGQVTVLKSTSDGVWAETPCPIIGDDSVSFDNIGLGDNGFPNGTVAANDILGFSQMADDDLSVIKFIHTYQIPGLK
ncbi:MAG: hypothetical protein C4531_01370 [Desulfurivibrio sp.]|nr:MAG: hypothetical protein C4531_01370 [Desulfurivibrio sp.]